MFNFKNKIKLKILIQAVIIGIYFAGATGEPLEIEYSLMSDKAIEIRDRMMKLTEPGGELSKKIKESNTNKKMFSLIMDMFGENGVYIPKRATSYLSNIVVIIENEANSAKKNLYEKAGDRSANGLIVIPTLIDSRLGGLGSEGYGAQVGYKFELDNRVDISPFIRFGGIGMSQYGKEEKNRGILKNNGIGLAGKIGGNDIHTKVVFMYTRGEVETLRKESKGGKDNEAKGKMKIETWLLGVESGYTWWVVKEDVGKGLKIEPHVGVTLISTNKDGYAEEGGENALKIKETNTDRVIADIGVRVGGKVNRKFNWKAGVGVDVVVGGARVEVLGRGDSGYYGGRDERGTDYYPKYGAPVESKNTEDENLKIEGNAGADCRIAKNAKIGANISLYRGIDGNYREVRGNVGLGVKLGAGRGVKAAERELRRAVERFTLKTKEKVEKKKYETSKILKKKNKEMEKKIKKLKEGRAKSM